MRDFTIGGSTKRAAMSPQDAQEPQMVPKSDVASGCSRGPLWVRPRQVEVHIVRSVRCGSGYRVDHCRQIGAPHMLNSLKNRNAALVSVAGILAFAVAILGLPNATASHGAVRHTASVQG